MTFFHTKTLKSSSKARRLNKTRKMKPNQLSPLRRSYGEVILQKGTILHHSSDTPFRARPSSEKPMLFTTFHPSDWEDTYITEIQLKKDVSLLFMIDTFRGIRVMPLLQKFVVPRGNNLVKKYDANLACFAQYLEKENFQGWMSTMEGNPNVEIALINSPDIFEVLSTESKTENWSNGYYDNHDRLIEKNFGKRYAISTLKKPATFLLNRRYKPLLEKYRIDAEEMSPNGWSLSIVLSNAKISYVDAPKEEFAWECVIPQIHHLSSERLP